MFTQKCFIRKNTPDLVKKLEELGYKALFSARNGYGKYLYTIGLVVIAGKYDAYHNEIGFVDCGTNEELFLAIAALRDDDCYMQYYWFDGKLLKCKGTGSTVKMNGDYSIKLITLGNSYIDVMIGNVRKATVQELMTEKVKKYLKEIFLRLEQRTTFIP